MDNQEFQAKVESINNFELRRAVERLREGLFDSLGVRLLTTGEEKLDAAFSRGVKNLEKNKPSHLCICGAYGQGKSHSLNYIKQQALAQNFVVSYVNLDPRQVPFYNFKGVYQALVKALEFPQTEQTSFVRVWKKRAAQWLDLPENTQKTFSDLIPQEIPHRFRAVLAAMAQKNMVIPPEKKALKKHATFKPWEFSWILKNVLMGKDIPLGRLGKVLYYRQVDFYKDHSLVCRGQEPYLALVQGMADLFQRIGFKGWLVLFDEGESISQNPISSRSKSYELLDRFFYPQKKSKNVSRALYSVFAFTPDFFALVEDEPYDRVKKKKKGQNETDPEVPYFKKDYNKAWKGIDIHTLHDLSSKEWKTLIHRLIKIHAGAYSWKPDMGLMEKEMIKQLSGVKGVEARLKLKFLVNHLDLEQQHQFMTCLAN